MCFGSVSYTHLDLDLGDLLTTLAGIALLFVPGGQIDVYKRQVYELDFSRESVAFAEQRGFKAEDVKMCIRDRFPKARLAATNADEKTIHLEKKKRFATITCRSIDGALTGSTESTPEGVMYLDDLVSDELEANNRNRLDTLWDKVRGDLLGRRLEGCPIVAQGTRYSLYDPCLLYTSDRRIADYKTDYVSVLRTIPRIYCTIRLYGCR